MANFTREWIFSPSLSDLDPNYDASIRIEFLLEEARKTEHSRNRRIKFREEASALACGHFCKSLDSSDTSTASYLQNTTDSDNTSVSSGTTPFSESDDTKERLWELHDLASTYASSKHFDNQMYFSEVLDKRKQEKKKENYAIKKEKKRFVIHSKRAAADAKAAAAAAAAEAAKQRSQLLDIMLQNPVANFPFLLALVGFLWNAEGSHYSKSRSTHRLFKGDRYPSQEKIVEEIGPLAWQSIHQKLFSAAYYELDFFQKQKEAEASSSMFTSSLFDSEPDEYKNYADDEG